MLVREPNFVQAAAWLIDKGQKRESNEDSVAALSFALASEDYPYPVGIYAVADGMGGHQGGEFASEMAIQTASRKLMDSLSVAVSPTPEQYNQWLAEAVNTANTSIYTHNLHQNMNMGTTLVLALVVGNQAYIANVGDSRAYTISEHAIQQVTLDHNMAHELYRCGAISQQEIETHPYKHVLSRAVGTNPDVDADLFQLTLQEGDTLLLCSDGLTRELDDESIFRAVHDAPSTHEACQSLMAEAKATKAQDNISIVLTHLKAL
jgi:serine/threonine protein phosphatase PrpC